MTALGRGGSERRVPPTGASLTINGQEARCRIRFMAAVPPGDEGFPGVYMVVFDRVTRRCGIEDLEYHRGHFFPSVGGARSTRTQLADRRGRSRGPRRQSRRAHTRAGGVPAQITLD